MMMFRGLWRTTRGTAAAEMALVTPLLLILMMGSVEIGNYFYNEHILVKAVRDGARYASRQPFDKFDCTGAGTVDASTATAIGNVTRTGVVAANSTTPIKVPGWVSNAPPLITVTVTCDPDGDATQNFGIYTDLPDGAPIVRVAADVPYRSLFFNLGFGTNGLGLRASSQAAVMGL